MKGKVFGDYESANAFFCFKKYVNNTKFSDTLM